MSHLPTIPLITFYKSDKGQTPALWTQELISEGRTEPHEYDPRDKECGNLETEIRKPQEVHHEPYHQYFPCRIAQCQYDHTYERDPPWCKKRTENAACAYR